MQPPGDGDAGRGAVLLLSYSYRPSGERQVVSNRIPAG